MASESRHQQPLVETTNTLKPAVVSLDLGTTATRACVAPFYLRDRRDEQPWLVLRSKHTQHRQQYDGCDIPSSANYLDVNKSPLSCIGYIGDGPNQTPAKMFPYIVRCTKLRERGREADLESEREYRQNIPQLDSFFKRFDQLDEDMQRWVLAHAQRIFLAHLRQVRSRTEELAKSRGVQITKIAATIPNNWDGWTQHFYNLLLARVWNHLDSDAIILLYESEAIGHWLLRFDQATQTEKPKQVVLADFGGHSMNTSVFKINYRDDGSGQFAFFTVSDDNCIHGGSELHTSYVKEQIREDITKQKIQVAKENEHYLWKTLMDDYRAYKRSNINEHKFWIEGRTNPNRINKMAADHVHVIFHAQQARKLYKACFGDPLTELYQLFKRSANNTTDTVVVLNGGTFSNDHILNETKEKIAAAGLSYLPCTEDVAFEGRRSSTVAVGAALAVVNSMTVEQFMNRAAFAVLVSPAESNNIPVIWNSHGSQKARISLQGRQGAEIFINCCPLAPHDGALSVPIESTFELQSLSTLSRNLQGEYTISLDYKKKVDSEGQPDRLVFTITKLVNEVPADVETIEWPVYYDPGACVSFLDYERYTERLRDSPGVSGLAPIRFRNRKGTHAYFLWENSRRDPSRHFWEEPEALGLPLPTLEEFEMGTTTLDDDQATIEKQDSDAGPVPTSSRPKRSGAARTEKARRQPTGLHDTSVGRIQKRAARAASGRRKGGQRAIRVPGSNYGTHPGPSQDIPVPDSEHGFADCSLAPVETNKEDLGTPRIQTISSSNQGGQEIEMAANYSQHIQHFPPLTLVAGQEAIQLATYSHDDIPLTTNATRGQSSGGTIPSLPPPTHGAENSSHHSMNTRSRIDPVQDGSYFVADGQPHEESVPYSAAEKENLATAIQSSQQFEQSMSRQAQTQKNENPVGLPLSTAPYSVTWANGTNKLIRRIGASFAEMSRDAQ